LILPLRKAFVAAPPASTAAPAVAAPGAAATAAPATTAEVVAVSLSATPPEAKLFLDDTALPTNPFAAKLARDSLLHRVRAEAPGHVAKSTGIVLDRDVAVVVTLDKERSTEPLVGGHPVVRPRPVGGGSLPAVASTASVPAPKADCNPPFVIDERGIKKYKPECL
jgi:serine/threonine-protein kinase